MRAIFAASATVTLLMYMKSIQGWIAASDAWIARPCTP